MNNTLALNSKLVHLHPVAPATDWEQVLDDWLSTKRSEHTRRVYRLDIVDFLSHHDGLTLGMFFSGDRHAAFELVTRYKGDLIDRGLTAATVNRRLAAIKSLTSHAYACGRCEFTLETVKSEKLTAYRDTTGVDPDTFKKLLAVPDRTTLKGKRDYALLVLLWSNALRRSEAVGANIGDFDPQAGTLRIFGKGKGTESEMVTLGKLAISAICNWLGARGETNPNAALFCSVNPGYRDGRLSTQAVYDVVRSAATIAGITKVMSPHRIRHSSITAALDATNGDVRKVQKLSRHANLNTLMIYDDNRVNQQAFVTELLDGLL